MQPRKLHCCIWRDSIKPSLRFSWFLCSLFPKAILYSTFTQEDFKNNLGKGPLNKTKYQMSKVLSTSFGKIFFFFGGWGWVQCFILNENVLLWLTIYYQEPFVFPTCALCSQIFTVKLIYDQKWVWPMQFLSSELDFWKFVNTNYSLIFFTDLKSYMFHHNILKISEHFNNRNLLKTCIQNTYPTKFCIFFSHFYYEEKIKIFYF